MSQSTYSQPGNQTNPPIPNNVSTPETDDNIITTGLQFYNEHQRDMFLAWRKQGRVGLMLMIIKLDKEEDKKYGKSAPPTAKMASDRLGQVHLLAILLTLSDDLIEHLILAQVYNHYDSPLKREALGVKTLPAESNVNKTSIDPVIYGNFFCDAHGKTLSYEQLIKVLNAVARYARDLRDNKTPPTRASVQSDPEKTWVGKIETEVNAGWPSGYKRADSSKSREAQRRYIRKSTHVTELEDWLSRIRQYAEDWRTNTINPDLTAPLPWSLSDIGWAFRQANRRHQHERHSSSIWIMNLVDAITRVELPASLIRQRFLALYRVPDIKLVRFAEHVISRLAGSYYLHHGFNFSLGGVTTHGDKVPIATYDEIRMSLDNAYIGKVDEHRQQLTYRTIFHDLSHRVKQLEEDRDSLRASKKDVVARKTKAQESLEDAYEELERFWLAYYDQNIVERARALGKDLKWMESVNVRMGELKTALRDEDNERKAMMQID